MERDIFLIFNERERGSVWEEREWGQGKKGPGEREREKEERGACQTYVSCTFNMTSFLSLRHPQESDKPR